MGSQGARLGGEAAAEALKELAKMCGTVTLAGILVWLGVQANVQPRIRHKHKRMSIFMPGGDTPQTTQHIIDAIHLGKKTSIVTYRGKIMLILEAGFLLHLRAKDNLALNGVMSILLLLLMKEGRPTILLSDLFQTLNSEYKVADGTGFLDNVKLWLARK